MSEPEEEQAAVEAKLELPSLSLRRRRRAAPTEQAVVDPVSEPVIEQAVAQAAAAPAPAKKATAKKAPPKKTTAKAPAAKKTVAAKKTAAPRKTAAKKVAPKPVEPPLGPPTVQLPVVAEPVQEPAAIEATPPRRRSLPSLSLPARVAALVAGAVVGLTGALLVYLSAQGCAAIRNTTSCGAAGVVLLVAIVVAMVLEGSLLLRAFGAADRMSTSFLGVGVLAVLTMVFLLGYADRWWMLVVAPVLAALSYLFAWWVTSHFSNEEPVRREPYLDL